MIVVGDSSSIFPFVDSLFTTACEIENLYCNSTSAAANDLHTYMQHVAIPDRKQTTFLSSISVTLTFS